MSDICVYTSMNSVVSLSIILCAFILFPGLAQAGLFKNAANIREKRQNQGCRLPPKPDNGDWKLTHGSGKPGDLVLSSTVIKFSCDPRYKLSQTSPYMICGENWDTKNLPTCNKLCPAIYSSASTTVKCTDKDGFSIECDEVVHGGALTFECIPYYESTQKKKLLCINGDWSSPKPVCQPTCGKKVNDDALTLLWNGQVLKTIKYPWVVAIYQQEDNKWENICGGNLISRKVVLTAAHCVTDNYGAAYPPENYKVASAKLYNKYGDDRDTQAQYLEVERIVVPEKYKGESRRFTSDIALIITKDLFKLGPLVQPVCFLGMEDIVLHPGFDIGEIAGWGVTESNAPSEVLRFLEIPYKSQTRCEQELPREWADKYAFEDKMCAGFFNQNISVCRGDSGSGLVFKNTDDNRYYIHGVVSLAPARDDGQCNFQQNSLYTKVKSYYTVIETNIITYNIDDCILPDYPSNGRYIVEGKEGKRPGEQVYSNDMLRISCNEGYVPTITKINCESATFNTLRCQIVESCPELHFPDGTELKCTDKRGNEIECSQATIGTKLSYTCPTGYISHTSTERTCSKDSWGDPVPSCVEKRLPDPSTNGTNVSTEIPEYNDDIKVICTYASWEAYNGINPEDLNPHLCTHIYYAFAGIWEKGDMRVQDDPLDLHRGLYKRVTDLKKRNKNLKVLLSVGGDRASNNSLWSIISSTDAKIGPFIGSTRYFIQEYGFDGLNIDWHYPEPSEKDKYIEFLKKVKNAYREKGWYLTASVKSDPEGTGYDPKRMDEILDWVILKTYDMYGGGWSSYTGEHTALYPSSQEYVWEKGHLNVDSVSKLWLDAGLSKEKLVISVAFYARSFKLKDPNQHGLHAGIDGPGIGNEGGVVKYSEICSKYDNWTEVWNDEQKSVYRYKGDQWFSYDTKDAIWIKAQYVKDKGFAGINAWPVDADDVFGTCGQKFRLLKHIHGGLGHSVNWDA